MDKKLVNLFVPAVQTSYDLLMPTNMKIQQLTKLLTDGIAEMCEGRFVISNKEILSQKDPDILFDPQKKLEDYGVDDGAHLVLM